MKCAVILLFVLLNTAYARSAKPNVLFISVDDLNDWIGCMGGHPQTKTPNFDRLARSGVLFSNAHCVAPACNPSRTAVMTGLSPHRTGLYANEQKMRAILPDAELMPVAFQKNGYWAGGSGKMLHYFIDARSWDDYFPEKESENPFPFTKYPDTRPLSLPRGGPWQYVETDWGPLAVDDEGFGGDYSVAEWIGKHLRQEHGKPFYLACGIYRPHEPWFVPEKYFEPFPLESIVLPPGFKEDDLEDLPPEGKRRGPNRYFAHIQKEGQWKQGLQGYLASIHFADAMLGRVLDALKEGPHRDNTIVVLWSDHGWHLGEKQHWQKFSPWRASTRVPLMIRVPKGSPGCKTGTTAGSICEQPVSLLSLYPTLLELCGLPARPALHGRSLVPLLKDEEADWPYVAYTWLHDAGSVAVSDRDWRYIHYKQGGEELYHIKKDPYEWNNLAVHPEYTAQLKALRQRVPSNLAPYRAPVVKHLPALKWNVLAVGEATPPSKPDGGTFDVVFINSSAVKVSLHWVDRRGEPNAYAVIAPGGSQRQSTRPGAVWQIADDSGRPLGYFRVADRSARGVIPGTQGELLRKK